MEKLEIVSGHLNRDIRAGERTMISASVYYPVPSGEAGAGTARIGRCFKNAAENIVSAAGGGLLREAEAAYAIAPEFFQPYEVSADYTVTYNDDGVLSLFTDVFLYAGGAHGVTYRYGSTWRVGSGHPLFVTSLFPEGAQIRRTVTAFVADRCREEGNLDEKGYQTMLTDARSHYTPENYYLTEQGLAVFYQQYALGPYTAGIPVFVLPYDEGGPYSPRRLAGEGRG